MDLNALRERINAIDDQIVELFVERMKTAAEIADAKRENNLPVLDANREQAVLKRIMAQAGEEFGLYASRLYQTMFDVSKSYQAALLAEDAQPAAKKRKLLVINGPNLNMLGIREKNIYGAETYADLVALLEKTFAEEGITGEIYQSNREGALVERIQQAYFDGTEGIVINPAAYTHTSVAILDALKAVNLPAVEVHLSDVSKREEFRQISYAGKACMKTIMGKGFLGYVEAIRFLKELQIQK